MTQSLLLDTCAAIWWSSRSKLAKASVDAINAAAARSDVYLSSVTAWEVALHEARGQSVLAVPALVWFEAACSLPGFGELDLTANILAASCTLPGDLHRDPADRFLIATARHHRLTLVTRDRKILEYAAAGHVQALAC